MQQTSTLQAPRTTRRPLWLLAGFWFCIVIALAVVLRRLVEFVNPSHGRPPQMAAIDATFASHELLTIFHIIPAAIFVILAAAILLRRGTSNWLERLFSSSEPSPAQPPMP